jgi:hypothetical protein
VSRDPDRAPAAVVEGIAGFEHSIANLYFLPYALAIKAWAGPDFWAAIGETRAAYSALTAGSALHNVAVATAGNLAGGSLMVGAVYWFVLPAARSWSRFVQGIDHDRPRGIPKSWFKLHPTGEKWSRRKPLDQHLCCPQAGIYGLGGCRVLIDVLLLGVMEAHQGFDGLDDTLPVADQVAVRIRGSEVACQPVQQARQMHDFAMRPAHRPKAVHIMQEPCKLGIHDPLVGLFMRHHLSHHPVRLSD